MFNKIRYNYIQQNDETNDDNIIVITMIIIINIIITIIIKITITMKQWPKITVSKLTKLIYRNDNR